MPNEELISLAERIEQLIDDAQGARYQAEFAASESEGCKAELIRVWTYISAAEKHLKKAKMAARAEEIKDASLHC